MSNEEIERQAAQWVVLLSDPEQFTEQAQAEFMAWRVLDPRHEAAAAAMEAVLCRVRKLAVQANTPPGRSALDAGLSARPKLLRDWRQGTMLLLWAVVLILPILAFVLPWSNQSVLTAAGQWRSVVLEDGTRLELAGASQVKILYSKQYRDIELLEGQIRVVVAKQPDRPLRVLSSQAVSQALGTEFIVQEQPQGTLLTVLSSRVLAYPRTQGPQAARELGPGDQVQINAQGLGVNRQTDVNSVIRTWDQRQLLLEHVPLTQALEQTTRQYAGKTQINPHGMEGLTVSAVLPADKPLSALALLKSLYPRLQVQNTPNEGLTINFRP
ncbi:FecR family protein [Alcaligenes aquatilis]|jgi:transmembrane sensor|uniref:FecR family protein n=1 Tax=Alcaligenes aquatilis TaxID=323284 RepID=UPI00355E320D|nr:FecR domain-containing protein [Alcaligenes faecalis]